MLLHYRKLGSGRPLFILHGLFGLSDNWNAIGKMLSSSTPALPFREGAKTPSSKENYAVYLIDLRNHGSSPHSDEWTYPAMAEDIHELQKNILNTEQTNIRTNEHSNSEHSPIILMGHSLGGKVAMQFAAMYPELIEKLIVADMAPKDYPGNQFPFIEKLLKIDLAAMKTRKEAEAELNKIIKDNATIQLLLKNIQWIENGSSSLLAWKFNLKVLAKNQNTIGNTFSLGEKTINTPTLFIRGERSNYILDSDIPQIKNHFPNSEIKTIAGAGHWVHADKPGEFGDAVWQFLNA